MVCEIRRLALKVAEPVDATHSTHEFEVRSKIARIERQHRQQPTGERTQRETQHRALIFLRIDPAHRAKFFGESHDAVRWSMDDSSDSPNALE